MKKLILTMATSVLFLAGCSIPPQSAKPAYGAISSQSQSTATLQSDAQTLRSNLAKRRAELKEAKLQAEIDRLNDEIVALEARLVDVERKISASASAASRPAGAYTGSGAVNTGPRGGKYTISPSGKKNYIRRK